MCQSSHEPWDHRRRGHFQSWLTTKSVNDWVHNKCVTDGVAPMQSIVWTHVESTIVTTEPSVMNSGAHTERSQGHLLRQERGSSELRLATVTAGDVLPPGVAHRKACGQAQRAQIQSTGVNICVTHDYLFGALGSPNSKKRGPLFGPVYGAVSIANIRAGQKKRSTWWPPVFRNGSRRFSPTAAVWHWSSFWGANGQTSRRVVRIAIDEIGN